MCTLNNLAFSFLRGTISPPPTLVALTYNHSVKRILWAIEWCARWLSRWSGWRDGVTWVYSGEFFWKSWILVQLHMSPKKYTSWTTLLMKQLNLPPLPTLTLYHRHTQPGSCLLTDVSEAAEHDDDLCCAGRGCRGGRGVKDWRSWAISVVHRCWKCYCTATHVCQTLCVLWII